MNYQLRADRTETPAEEALRYAKRLDDLRGILNHVVRGIDDALMRCGGNVSRELCGVLGRDGVFEQFVQTVQHMLNGEPLADQFSFECALKRVLAKEQTR